MILMSNEKDEEAFRELDSIILSERSIWHPEIYLLYLELSMVLCKDLKAAALRAMNNCPIAKVLLQIKRMNISEYSEISDILKNKNPEEYLICLEREKLFTEAVNFINSGKIIAEALDQINAINSKTAAEISEELQTKYKRRTSLIKMISRF